ESISGPHGDGADNVVAQQLLDLEGERALAVVQVDFEGVVDLGHELGAELHVEDGADDADQAALWSARRGLLRLESLLLQQVVRLVGLAEPAGIAQAGQHSYQRQSVGTRVSDVCLDLADSVVAVSVWKPAEAGAQNVQVALAGAGILIHGGPPRPHWSQCAGW